MAINTLPQALPRLIPASEVLSTTKKIIEELNTTYDHVVQTVTIAEACFENVIRPIIDVENRTQGETGMIAMLRYASPDDIARKASDEACKLLGECDAAMSSREDLYVLVNAVRDRNEERDLESAKYLDTLLRRFRRSGMGVLDANSAQKYLSTRNHIDDLRREFNRNIREESGTIRFSLVELQGVPQRDLDRFGKSPEPHEEDVCMVDFSRASHDAILEHALDPVTRKRFWVANANKLRQNVPLFDEIVTLRRENAQLLGYASHAAFRLEVRVAKTPEWVNSLLDSLQEALTPQGRKEMNALLDLKKRHLGNQSRAGQTDDVDAMWPWDYWFYTRMAGEATQLDHARISEYYPLPYVLPAMLEIFASCLQLRFTPIPNILLEGSTWHDDVEAWSVWDDRESSKDDFVGYLYADLLWRPNKYQGNQCVNLQCGYRKGESRVYPATILMCAFPRPTEGGCALLKHSQIVTLFHELGHGIHDLVSRTAYVAFHGFRAPPDFAESPSIMLENWCWVKAELEKMSCHFTTLDSKYHESWKKENPGVAVPPTRIPDNLLDSLVASRNSNRSMWFLRQLVHARLDMAVHHTTDDKVVDASKLCVDLAEELTFQPNPNPADHGHQAADFGHLMAGYDAGYYSYLAAHVFAASLFETTFAEDPRNQAAWDRYRRGILEFGGSRDELHMLEGFMGRAASTEDLLRSLGIHRDDAKKTL